MFKCKAILSLVFLAGAMATAHANYPNAQLQDFDIDLGPEGGTINMASGQFTMSTLQMTLPNRNLVIDRHVNTLHYKGPEFEVNWELPLMLQDVSSFKIDNFNYLSQERSFSLTIDKAQWQQQEGPGELLQFSLTSIFAAGEVMPADTLESYLEKSIMSIAHVTVAKGISFPIPGKPKPIEMKTLNAIKGQFAHHLLTFNAQIAGLIPINVQFKGLITTLKAQDGIQLDVQSFVIAGLEMKALLLAELKKKESPQFKVSGSTILWAKTQKQL